MTITELIRTVMGFACVFAGVIAGLKHDYEKGVGLIGLGVLLIMGLEIKLEETDADTYNPNQH